MFGLSAGELILVFIVALVLLGPEKIPEVARWLGKTSAELKRVSDGFRREFYNSVYVPPPEQGNVGNRSLTSGKESVPAAASPTAETAPEPPASTESSTASGEPPVTPAL
jgi:Sec-independent protein translocase protein TatA